MRAPIGAWEKNTASKPVTVSSTYSHIQPEVPNKTHISGVNQYFAELVSTETTQAGVVGFITENNYLVSFLCITGKGCQVINLD